MPAYPAPPPFLMPSITLARPISIQARQRCFSTTACSYAQPAFQDEASSPIDRTESTSGTRKSAEGSRKAAADHSRYRFPRSDNPSPYEILHLPRTAGTGDIKSRYYHLAKLYHPDSPHSHPDSSPQNFATIHRAYVLLTSPSARDTYNRTGLGWSAGSSSRSGPSGGRGGAGSRWGDEEILKQARARASGATQGSAWSDTYSRAKWDGTFNFEADGPGGAKGNPDGNYVSNHRFMGSLLVLGLTFGLLQVNRAFSSSAIHRDELDRRHQSAAAALTEAKQDALIYGKERRERIRRFVRGMEVEREYERMAAGEGSGEEGEVEGGDFRRGGRVGEKTLEERARDRKDFERVLVPESIAGSRLPPKTTSL